MDFGWNLEQQAWASRTLEFANRDLNERLNERDRAQEFGSREWEKCSQFGLLRVPVSLESGGFGLNCLTTACIYEAFGEGCRDGGLGMAVSAHVFACLMPLDRFGAGRQRDLIPLLSRGALIGASAITEPDAGSDVFSLRTRAIRCGDSYEISGDKVFVTNGPIADIFIVYAATKPSAGFMGISAFLVERDRVGLVVGSNAERIGLRTASMGSLRLERCIIPESNRLGAESQAGWVFNFAMSWERTCLFAFWVGTMQRQLRQVTEHARRRTQFGRPIGSNQAVAHRISDMKIRLESARLLLYRSCWEMDTGNMDPMFISAAKLAVSEAAVQSSLDAIQIFGGAGVLAETGIEMCLRDTVSGRIYSGTSEIHRSIIARRLGLPLSQAT